MKATTEIKLKVKLGTLSEVKMAEALKALKEIKRIIEKEHSCRCTLFEIEIV